MSLIWHHTNCWKLGSNPDRNVTIIIVVVITIVVVVVVVVIIIMMNYARAEMHVPTRTLVKL